MMLHPRDSRDQRVIRADLKISPEPSSLRLVQDAFGNSVGIARFSGRSRQLSFESIVCLEHSPRDLEDAGWALPVHYSVSELRDLAEYIERHQPDPIDGVGSWAREFLASRGSISAFDLLARFSQGIHHGFRYRRREAKGIQPPLETLGLRHGSCRDFAVLMIEAARSFGFAARFVSGYLAVLLDHPQKATNGSARGSNSRVGANLLARHWLDRLRSDQRQRRQHRPGHRCDRARSSPRDPASRHLFWISVGSPRNGGASERHVRYSGGDLGCPPTGPTSTIWQIGVIDVERDTERGSRRAFPRFCF